MVPTPTETLRPAVEVDSRPDGVLVLSCPIPPVDAGTNMVEVLLDRAREHPDRPIISEQEAPGEWQHLTYGEAVAGCRRVAQWLLDHGASPERPLVVLSPRSRRHFLVAWGAQMAGVPYCPVSVPYSTVPGAFPKLRWVLERVAPAFVYAEDLPAHAAALDTIPAESELGESMSAATFISGDGSDGSVPFAEVVATEATGDVDRAIRSIDGDTVTRYLFTSGSTGMPKGVIQTHTMHMAFLGAMKAIDASEPERALRVLDWMPWSHTASGVMRLNMVIHGGGSIYLDPGRPLPGHFDRTVDNLGVVKPTSYSGSPIGWTMLVDALEADDDLAAGFFAHAGSFGFGAAAMPTALAERIQQLAVRHLGTPILLTTSLLSTEVSVCLNRWWPTEDHSVLGLPGPGADVKLVPVGENRYEIRPRGLGVTPGYIGDPAATAAAFDDEGYFRMGDAVRFADPDDPQRGLCFAGRVAEDFKLSTGTWVEAGTLRSKVIAAASPYVRDAVICGLNETEVTALVWPNLDRCRDLAGAEHPAHSAAVRDAVAAGLARHNSANPSSSTRVRRFILLEDPPDQTAQEITEKGYINQRAVQDHRDDAVARLYATDVPGGVPGDVVVVPDPGAGGSRE